MGSAIIPIAGWLDQAYDEALVYRGVTWRHVEGGFGGRGDRDDWVADLPAGSISVNRYLWKAKAPWPNEQAGYGYNGDRTRDDEMDRALERGLARIEFSLEATIQTLAAQVAAKAKLKIALDT